MLIVYGFKNFFEKSNITYDYSCVMYEMPRVIADLVLDWSTANIKEEDLYLNHKEGRVKNTHITILYGLHTNNLEEIQNITDKFEPVKIELGVIKKFQNKNFDVINIEVKGQQLFKMNKSLKKLKYTCEHPNYIPHCTIAYVKKNSCDHLLGRKYFFGKKLLLKKLVFTSPIKGRLVLKSALVG